MEPSLLMFHKSGQESAGIYSKKQHSTMTCTCRVTNCRRLSEVKRKRPGCLLCVPKMEKLMTIFAKLAMAVLVIAGQNLFDCIFSYIH